MNVEKRKLKKYLSVLTLVLALVFTFVRIFKPDFYNRYLNTSSPVRSESTKQKLETPAPIIGDGNKNSTANTEDYPQCSGQQTCVAKVTRVVDGDTIELSTGEKVRYIGMDTPETKHPFKKVQCFGVEASEKNTELVYDKEVRLEKDVSDKDRYGRLLRYVYLSTGQRNVDEIFVNDYLARQGFAHVATFPPDVKFSKQFVEAEREARVNNRGLWAPGVCP